MRGEPGTLQSDPMRRLVLILCLSTAAPLASAQVQIDPDSLPGRLPESGLAAPREARQPLRTLERGLTPSEAARQVQRRHGGRVLAVQSDGIGYRVKVLKEGEVRIYLVTP